MKRFRWPLQRLLDVTRQRELAQRGELLRISREMARLRHEIVARQRRVRASLAELARQAPADRIARQEMVMALSARPQRDIRRLTGQLHQAERQRKDQTDRLVKIKKSRETLEKMRERARMAHLREQLRLEQKQLDDGTHVAYAHKALKARAASESAGGGHG